MSMIDKMSISGIRSFGQHEPQVIDFFKPLTIIVGHNGAGKTTVIEALKFATTGQLPPNSSQGKTFVHDPKLDNETEMNAQVKMKFRTANGLSIVATRQMKVTEKKKSTSFSRGDAILQCWERKSKTKSTISNRVADIDQKIPDLLGVSKAILENVIFCHQEDSNWPLSDAKTLKGKFDEIFAATRYTKALEAMRKSKTEKTAEMKKVEAELSGLKQSADAGQEVKRKLRETEMKIESLSKKSQDLKENIEQLKVDLTKSGSLQSAVNQSKTKLEWESNQLEEQRQECQRVKDGMEVVVKETLAELQRKLPEVERKCTEANEQGQQDQDEIKHKAAEIDTIDKQKSKLNEDRAHLKSLVIAHQEKEQMCKENVNKIAKKYKQQPPHEMDRTRLREFKTIISAIKQSEEDEFLDWKESRRKVLEEKQTKLKEVEAGMKQNTISIEAKRKEKNQVEEQLKGLDSNLRQKEDSVDGTDIETALSNAEHSHKKNEGRKDDHQLAMRSANLQAEVASAKKELKDLENNKDSLAEEVKTCADSMRKHQYKGKETENLRTQIQQKIKNNRTLIEEVLGVGVTTGKQLGRVKNKINDLETDKGSLQSEIGKLEVEEGTIRGQLKMKKQELHSADGQKNGEMKKLAAAGISNGLKGWQEEKDRITGELKEVEERLGDSPKLVRALELFAKMMKSGKNKCPCCGTGAMGEEHLKYLEKQKQKMSNSSPALGVEVNELKAKLKTLDVLQSSAQRVEDLQGNTLLSLRQQINSLSGQVSEYSSQLGPKKSELDELDDQLKKALELRPIAEEVALKTADIEEWDEWVKNHGSGETQQRQKTLEKELEVVNKKIVDLKAQLTANELKYQEDTAKLQRLADQVTKSQALLSTFRLQFSETKQLKERIEECKARRDTLGELATSLTEQRPKLLKEIEDLTSEYNTARKEHETEEEMKSAHLNGIRADAQKCMEMEREMSRFSNNPVEDVEQKEQEISQADETVRKLRSEVEAKQNASEAVQKKIHSANRARSIIKENIHMRTLEAEVEKKQGTIKEICDKLEQDEAELSTFDHTYIELQNMFEEKQGTFHRLEGELKQCQVVKKDNHDLLKQKAFKNIEERVRGKNVEAETTKMAIKDLEKFHNALDRALMKYHSMKMDEINKSIAELWQLTYQGNDIDKIKLTHDNEASSSAKRNYNYRMVMVKKGKEVDMRGRCSAGQKVLASLVLRLALAETFGTRCGVLALDEPTTNLDSANIRAFAIALCDIIRERMRQKNFQLIIITHDEDFVSTLSQYHCHADHFYRVSKNANQHSTIEKFDLIELDR